MTALEYYKNLDNHPFTGTRQVDFDARVSQEPHIMKHFNGAPNYDQVKHVTPGNVYHIFQVEGFGDAADFTFNDDAGRPHTLGSFFFKDPN